MESGYEVAVRDGVGTDAADGPPTSAYQHSEDPRLRLALDDAWRAIDVQRDQLGEIKSRTIALLSVATIAVGLLGDRAFLEGDQPSRWGYVTLGAFCVLSLAAVSVSVPQRWSFARKPSALSWYPHSGKTIDEMRSGLLADAAEHFQTHERKLKRLSVAQVASVLAVGVVAAALLVNSITD